MSELLKTMSEVVEKLDQLPPQSNSLEFVRLSIIEYLKSFEEVILCLE